MTSDATPRDAITDRAIRLFQFLLRAQEIRDEPARTIDAYRRDGGVLWFGDLPHHRAVVTALREGEPEDGLPILTVDRTPRLAPPKPDDLLEPWIDGPRDEPAAEPTLRDSITRAADDDVQQNGDLPGRVVRADDHPEVAERFAAWLQSWRAWAEQERRDRPARDLYAELFSMYVNALGHAEELELVVGVGCLSWTPPDHPAVQRHLLTAPVAIAFDDDSGRLDVVPAEAVEPLAVEVDMLDARLITQPQQLNESRARAREFAANVLDRAESGGIVRRIVHALSPDAEYRDVDEPPSGTDHPVTAFAPALLLRKRARTGLVEIFRTIVEQLMASGTVPAGVLPLVDPEYVPALGRVANEGAVVRVDDEPFLPIPVNARQLEILERVDTHAQTLVQGPPGTGKTHTAAALISHLLAQGKRVLVTAHTDRALKEVRAKLPEAIRPLAVSVVGSTREDMSDLRTAVERIAARAADHDDARENARAQRALRAIDELRERRAADYRDLLAAREDEVKVHEFAGYRGTLAAIARELTADGDRYRWLAEYVTDVYRPAPLSSQEIVEWHALVADADLVADEPEARSREFDPVSVPDPPQFAALVAQEVAAIDADRRMEQRRSHPAAADLHQVPAETREALRARLIGLIREFGHLANRREQWMPAALADVRSRRGEPWRARHHTVGSLLAQAAPLVQRLGAVTDVVLRDGTDPAPLVPLARALREHLAAGRTLKVGPDGQPRPGTFAPKPVKQAGPFFDSVRVDGIPATTIGQVDAFLTWVEATRTLDALDRAWPADTAIPPEDTLHERLQWHVGEIRQLERVLALGAELSREEHRLVQSGLPIPDWTDTTAVVTYSELVDAAAAADALVSARRPLQELERRLADESQWEAAAPTVRSMLEAVRRRDRERYAADHRRLGRLVEARRRLVRRDELGARLGAETELLHAAVTEHPGCPEWPDRLAGFSQAWAWAAASTFVRNRRALDVNRVQAEISDTEHQIRAQVEDLAAIRAWSHAVAPGRLTRTARASLEHYAYLVRRLGKGTGKYQAQRKAEIRQAMDGCRDAVPVWILPIYRIADQLRIQPDMFDVVVVDEASQAGQEATFLQYLAPRVVVIGDDKQVSPSAVGVDQQQLRDLAAQLLYDHPYRSGWQDPKRSLFDEARKSFTGMLTLVEHRRCVPEIIEFSNRIAYEPDGVRLVPVRQFGSDRLDPIKPVLLENGFQRGTTNPINPAEADAIVEQIEKCCVDPRYDGLTFGVISLLGTGQAKHIEKRLQESLSAEEWLARDMRCGDAADFQGSERDVMFLSMVAAPEPGRRRTALTGEQFVQRYNVAASRAKDQMWLFHSIRLEDLTNPDDMRFRLLEHCYRVERAPELADQAITEPLPELTRVAPFASLFPQQVCSRLVERGFAVIPDFEALGYRLDLVVVGATTRLAVQCDRDSWEGPDAYRRDLAAQRELERCGWTLVRLRESEFSIDPARALRPVWDTLARLGIRSRHGTAESDGPSEASPSLDEHVVQHPAAATGSDDPESTGDDGATDDLGAASPAAGDPDESEFGGFQPADAIPDGPNNEKGITEAPQADNTTPDGPSDEDIPAQQRPVSIPAVDQLLLPYSPFRGNLVPVGVAERTEIVAGLVAIVAAEGPVLGHRLHSVYVRSSDGMRVGHQIAKVLNSAVTSAIRRGHIVEDDPLGEPGVRPRTFRLPEQPPVLVRELGPRAFEHVPPAELAAVMLAAGDLVSWDDIEGVFRATLETYGIRRLGSSIRARLTAVAPLAQRLRDAGYR